jgi:hypothetical protein
VVTAALVVGAAGALVRRTAAAFDPFTAYPGHTADYGVERSRAIRAAIPLMAERPERSIVVIGSSGVARAFVPTVFDAALDGSRHRHVSFNLAQFLIQPETDLATAMLIRQTYEERGKRVAVTVFGISSPELTKSFVPGARKRQPDQAYAFTTADTIADRARSEPLAALGDGLDYLVFGDVRPERVGSWVADRLGAAHSVGCNSGMKQPPDTEEGQTALVGFCNELLRQFPLGIPPWNLSTRGGFGFGMPETRPMLEQLVAAQTKVMAETSPGPPGPPGPPEAPWPPPDPIDEDAVRTVIAAVRELRAVSDHMFVLRDVLNPEIPQSHAQLAHWRAVAEWIAREGDAPLLDFNDGTFAPADFGDRTHLHPLAAERFSKLLAARVQATVQDDRASR